MVVKSHWATLCLKDLSALISNVDVYRRLYVLLVSDFCNIQSFF